MSNYLPTGNEYISLPRVNELTGAIETVGFLTMAQRGMIELRGSDEAPFMQPFADFDHGPFKWQREHFWIPAAVADGDKASIRLTVLTPISERGFAVRFELTAGESGRYSVGLRGTWSCTAHCVNEEKPVEGTMHCYESSWNNSLIFDFRIGFPAFAFAPMCTAECQSTRHNTDGAIEYELKSSLDLSTGETGAVVFYFGFGYEEVAAATSAKEMLRRGWDWEYAKTAKYLDARSRSLKTPRLTELYNVNLFFCLFYATGLTLDTEELICATSRSSRYYVSAAYWDRDTLLWSFPTILSADKALAKNVLKYIFTRQSRNLGIHSRYIDGTVLEPGFELDELMAPVIALDTYVRKTGDTDFLAERYIRDSLDDILLRLEDVRHPDIPLYETFLQPTDDERVYPYLTYDNALVYRALKALSELYPDKYAALSSLADEVRAAVLENCVFHDENGQPYFGWSVDLQGRHDIYDEPPGSLQLLPYYGFCSSDNETWLNTVAMIRSPAYRFSFAGCPIAEIGCPHAPYPWILSLANSLLCGHKEQALKELEIIKMDNLIACESVDSEHGECTTGAAFATCAGFLCHAIATALEE